MTDGGQPFARRTVLKTIGGAITTSAFAGRTSANQNRQRLVNAEKENGTITTTDDDFVVQGQEADTIIATHSGRITDNTVEGGHDLILVSGEVDVQTSGNDLTGVSGTANGINYQGSATGTIRDNSVTEIDIDDPEAAGTGILLFETSGVSVVENTVTDITDSTGLAIASFGSGDAVDNTVTDNTFENVVNGISLQRAAFFGGDPVVADNGVENNTLEGRGNSGDGIQFIDATFEIEIEFDNTNFGAEFEFENNSIINNRISGFETEVEEDGSNDSLARATDDNSN